MIRNTSVCRNTNRHHILHYFTVGLKSVRHTRDSVSNHRLPNWMTEAMHVPDSPFRTPIFKILCGNPKTFHWISIFDESTAHPKHTPHTPDRIQKTFNLLA